MKKIIALIFVINAVAGANGLFAQEPASAEPIKFPDIFIDEDYKVRVEAGAKRFPGRPAALTAEELDSLNSLQKETSVLIPPHPLPRNVLDRGYPKGFAKASFGAYWSPSVEAGYEYEESDYDFFAVGGWNYGAGHLDNAEYNNLYFNFLTDYYAPEKYFIFGGSKTRVKASVNNESYKLFASGAAPARSATDYLLSIGVDGSYLDYAYEGEASMRGVSLSQDESDAFENIVSGVAKITKSGKAGEFGGKADLEFGSLRGTGKAFGSAAAVAKIISGDLTYLVDIGGQFANSTFNESKAGLLIDGKVLYRAGKNSTLAGRFRTGFEKNSFMDNLKRNPYLFFDTDIDFPFVLPEISAIYSYAPDVYTKASLGAKFALIEDYPIFAPTGAATFGLIYDKVNIFTIEADAERDLTDKDKISLEARFSATSMSDNGKNIPYFAPFEINVDYRRQWSEKTGTQIGIFYYAKRYADIENDKELDGFPDLSLSGDYRINDKYKIFLNFENLTNPDIFIWDGYKQRGFFASAGVLFQF